MQNIKQTYNIHVHYLITNFVLSFSDGKTILAWESFT